MKPILFLALDVQNTDEAIALLRKAGPGLSHVKVGLELFIAEGKEVIFDLVEMGKFVFLDLKLHDIPATVQRAAQQVAMLGADYTTVHVPGGKEMMQAAVNGVGSAKTKVLGVTVLTSLELSDLAAVGTTADSISELVVKRALLAKEAGCHGVIASPKEARAIRDVVGSEFLIITPGVRPSGKEEGDQKRVGTARGAIEDGANGIVVGRPIRDAADPAQAVELLLKEIGAE